MAQQALKLQDAEGVTLLVQRIDDVGYTIGLQDTGEFPVIFRLLDDDDRRQLRDFLKSLG